MKRLMMLLVGLSLPVWAGYDFTITNGYFETKTLIENQTLLMTGGGGYHLALFDKSYASIQNTSLLSEGTVGIWEIQIAGYSSLDFLGGQVHRLDVSSYAYIYIYITGKSIKYIVLKMLHIQSILRFSASQGLITIPRQVI